VCCPAGAHDGGWCSVLAGCGGAAVVLPAGELVDLTLPAEDLWGGAAAHLGELLADAPGPDAALERLQRYLLRRQERADDPDRSSPRPCAV